MDREIDAQISPVFIGHCPLLGPLPKKKKKEKKEMEKKKTVEKETKRKLWK